jgi:DNA processing protein
LNQNGVPSERWGARKNFFRTSKAAMDDSLFHLVLAQIPFFSYSDFAYLRAQMRELSIAPSEFVQMRPIERRKNFRLAPSVHSYLDSAAGSLAVLRKLHTRLARQHICFLTALDDSYPHALRKLPENVRPPFLFLKGNTSALARPYQIAIVGTRRATPLAMRVTRAYARALASHGANIISGGASGIDTEAHLGALEAGGATTIVLPQGILTFDPKPPLAKSMSLGATLFISQFPPLQEWSAACAVMRNTVIAALAQAAIVGETLLRSGTAYVIRQTLRDRKPLFVIVYEGDAASARASHSLLSSGARSLPPTPAISKAAISTILRSIK